MSRTGLGRGRKALALRERKVVGLRCGWRRRTAAWLFFLIDNFMHASVLEHDALAGLDVIVAAVEDAGDKDVRRVGAAVVDAGITVFAEADFDFGGAGSADKDAEIRGEEDVCAAACGEAGLDGAMIHRHHEAGRIAGGRGGIRGELDGGGGADAEGAALRKKYISGGGTGGDGAARRDDGLIRCDLERSGDGGAGGRFALLERNDGDGAGGLRYGWGGLSGRA